jgi:hypothetical protein
MLQSIQSYVGLAMKAGIGYCKAKTPRKSGAMALITPSQMCPATTLSLWSKKLKVKFKRNKHREYTRPVNKCCPS